MSRQTEFFQAVAGRNIVRVRVAAIVVSNGNVLASGTLHNVSHLSVAP